MRADTLYRTLIVASLVLTPIYIIYVYWETSFLPDHWQSTMEMHGDSAILLTDQFFINNPNLSIVFFVLLLLCWSILLMCMFFYVRYSREVFLAVLIIATLLLPFYGLNVISPIEMFLSYLEPIMDGMIITLAYFSPIKDRFGVTPENGLD